MEDTLREALHLYFGPQEVALIEKYREHGELLNYELYLPREWASKYMAEASQLGLIILAVEFTSLRGVGKTLIYYADYSAYSSSPDAVQKCRELAEKDLSQWPTEADRAAFTLNG